MKNFCLVIIFLGLFPPLAEAGYYSDAQEDELQFSYDYECTEDCSGHEAGYEWAAENDITDPDDCGGKSQSFMEGCEAYAEEHEEHEEQEEERYYRR